MNRLSRIVTTAAVVGATVGGLMWSADAAAPHGSAAEVIFETGAKGPLADPGYAIVGGWWGHEGAAHTGATYFSLNGAGGTGVVNTASIAALHQALDDGGSFENLRVAFVPASADGSTERPLVHKGEVAGDAFQWWTDMGMGSGVAGSGGPTDYGTFISTQTQWDAFWRQGRPVQAFDSHLVLHDVATGSVSTAPEGTSILNAWPAGTKISVVLYASDGYNGSLEPTVKVGPDGRAVSAWLTIRTLARPGDPVRTSAGYQVLTASPGEGDKLVGGMPPAAATYDPSAGDSRTTAPTTSPSGQPTSSTHTGRTTQIAGPGRASSRSSIAKVVDSGWTWAVVVILVGAGLWVLVRRWRSVGRSR
ncbi:hypothetical protein Back2_12690 [Nocardioides baekrokdamisoli]|uniref:Uncharacterized protein n=1 Tax=Nocardioides baekrokdamisoli TaxID=1804624 RepID=A0A3G9IF79_9ACTN|nr:hypothetical protein [Nocardioides baekrokdamisoli]BBH16982.1 hypothetical protein Back2_12690 [Nocardioides baekrokdamisoli]